MDPKHDLLVDGQSINQICHILDVRRTMGPPVKNRKISVKLLVRHDIMKTIDVLNRTLTGQMQQFIFTDQPDRFWRGRVLSDIKPTSSWQNAEISFEIEVPSGVAYSLEYVNKSFKSAVAIEIENRGTNPVRPILDIQCTDKTCIVAAELVTATM